MSFQSNLTDVIKLYLYVYIVTFSSYNVTYIVAVECFSSTKLQDFFKHSIHLLSFAVSNKMKVINTAICTIQHTNLMSLSKLHNNLQTFKSVCVLEFV